MMSGRLGDNPELERLDGEPGPATPLAPDSAGALIERALSRVADEADPLARAMQPLDATGPAAPMMPHKVDALVAAALDGGWQGGTRQARRRLLPRVLQLPLAAIVLVSLALGAAATVGVFHLVRSYKAPPSQPPRVNRHAAARRRPKQRARPIRPALQPPRIDAATPLQDTAAGQNRRHQRRRLRKPKASAGSLLAKANELRRQRRWQRAERVYRQLLRHYRNSGAGYTARVAVASLYLEHLGQPKRALRQYRAALAYALSGVLAEEARFGICEAYRALARPGAERAALRRFIKKHPRSPLASRARARLRELSH